MVVFVICYSSYKQEDQYFFLKIYFCYLKICVCECVGMCIWVQMPEIARDTEFP